MTRIVISGYYGFANAGDEAMLTAIISALRSVENPAELTVISGSPEITAARYGVISIHRFNFLKIINVLSGCDLLLSGGGSLLQDVTSRKSLLYYLTVLVLGRVFSRKVMLFAQGIGPIKSRNLKKLTGIICNKADLITVRDTDSLKELEQMGVSKNCVHLTADAVLTLKKGDKKLGEKLLQQFGIERDKPLVAVSVRKWQAAGSYLKELADAVAAIAADYKARVVFLPLQYPDDVEACRNLHNILPEETEAYVLDAEYDTEQFLALIANFSLLIGMRLHALIFAAITEIPFVALSCDPKIDGFIKEIGGVSAGNIDKLNAENIKAAAENALAENAACGQRLSEMCKNAQLNFDMAFALLQDGKTEREQKGDGGNAVND
ncbi:MAG: polysaccharide pyruvyl transferase CsaB [Phascolarctobacterium sp.]|nr:polysaccharide pyruvyl transferase CsaB [Phascolarctobacterium sp.]